MFMEKFLIYGGEKLFGNIKVDCAKNAYLPIMAASVMTEDEVVLKSMPNILDIQNMRKILEFLGAETKIDESNLHIFGKNIKNSTISNNLSKNLRSSVFMLGPLLARFKKAKVSYPGGCNIGLRPIDLHLKGLKELGAKVVENHGSIFCDGSKMKSGTVILDYPSVGATENLMMASIFLPGVTKIYNSAKEPEIVDLQNFLNSMGACVCGAGSDEITITGVQKLFGTTYKPIPDRIVAGTLLIACAMCGGKITLENVVPEHFLSLTDKLQKSGCKIVVSSDKITIESKGKPKSVEIVETLPYPGFPTDLQSQILAMQTISKGVCVVRENLFETRFRFAQELIKMGANIKLCGQTAFVCGVKELMGAEVFASDLRGGAALVLAGLCAKGHTTVHGVHHIDRGYSSFEKVLSALGAKITRESENL